MWMYDEDFIVNQGLSSLSAVVGMLFYVYRKIEMEWAREEARWHLSISWL